MSGKFEGSSGTGAIMEDGTFAKEVTSYRTSRNAWCHEEPCRSLAVSMNVEDKIAALTGVPRENQEYLQVGANPCRAPPSAGVPPPSSSLRAATLCVISAALGLAVGVQETSPWGVGQGPVTICD